MNGGVVVTGASTGIGAAIARHLAERGFRVFGTVRRAEDEVALARDGVTPVRMDVTDAASIMRARGEVERALGATPLIALVNNAGPRGKLDRRRCCHAGVPGAPQGVGAALCHS